MRHGTAPTHSTALRGVAAEVGKKGLRQTAGQLSERLRERTRMEPGKPKMTMPDPVVYRREQAMAYVAHRLPGVYACTFRVMNEVRAAAWING